MGPYVHDSQGDIALPYVHDAEGDFEGERSERILAIDGLRKSTVLSVSVCIEIMKAAAVTLISPEITGQCEDILNDVDQITIEDCRLIADIRELVNLRPGTSEHCSEALGEEGQVVAMTVEDCLEMLHNTAAVLQILQATSLEQIFDLQSTIFEECNRVLSSSVSSIERESCDDINLIMRGVSVELTPQILNHCREERRGGNMTAEFCIEIIKASEVISVDSQTIEHCRDLINQDVTELDERNCGEILQSMELFSVSSSVSEHCRLVLVTQITTADCLKVLRNTAQLLQIVQASVPASPAEVFQLRPEPVERCSQLINDLTEIRAEDCEDIREINRISTLLEIQQETRKFCKI